VISFLDFINRARVLQGLDEWRALRLIETEADDERGGLVAFARGVPVWSETATVVPSEAIPTRG
jgi:hypothetical protein